MLQNIAIKSKFCLVTQMPVPIRVFSLYFSPPLLLMQDTFCHLLCVQSTHVSTPNLAIGILGFHSIMGLQSKKRQFSLHAPKNSS